MKTTETEQALQADPELDALLAQMAEEVPPMPADFHDRWVNAVRADAQQKAEPARGEKPGKIVSMNRWARVLSTAAVLVFLFGGTLLYRNSRKPLSPVSSVPPAVLSSREDAEVSQEDSAAEDEAMEFAGEAGESGCFAMPEIQTDREEADVPRENSAGESGPSIAAGGAGESGYAVSEPAQEARENTAGESRYQAAEKDKAVTDAEEAEFDSAAEAPAVQPTALPTAAPTLPPAEAEEEAAAGIAEKPEAEETAGPAGFLQEAGGFFADMLRFLLLALPYLLGAAAIAAAVVLARRKNRKG